ncbi:iron-containing redox enzyme family protein [Acinetobacter sp. AYS6]|uniref:iron-containing redox enzyme family protein n=1 Tax=Acinetobacter sp. AYS6 TaxID=2983297 RepID=UPI0021D698C7|nr:iron-containing redox enzyme family protein [Acinetobacter sp. AYS6]MCU7696727.1 iron-containing redox enzyme family protein [Acinetobacter sp. AYS6]
MEKQLNKKNSELYLIDFNQWLQLPLNESIEKIINTADLNDLLLNIGEELQEKYIENIDKILKSAFSLKDNKSSKEIHLTLYSLYNLQICDPLSTQSYNQHNYFLYKIRQKIESYWLDSLKIDFISHTFESTEKVSQSIISLCEKKRLSNHPLFDFLAKDANKKQLYTFFQSDYDLNIRFFDLLVLALINSPSSARKEMIKNLWDESGRGNNSETHVNMFNDLIENLSIENKEQIRVHDSWQKAAGYNLFMFAALNRQHYFFLLGIMAATEIIDPQSYLKVIEACKRHNIDERLYRYYTEHADIDVEHAKGWLTYVIEPLVEKIDVKQSILMGAYHRLKTCKDYYDSLYEHLKTI